MNDISGQISQAQQDGGRGFGFNPFAKLATKIDINQLPTQAEAEAKRAEEQAKREAAEAEAKQAEIEDLKAEIEDLKAEAQAMADDEDDEPEAQPVEEPKSEVKVEEPEAQAEDKGEEPEAQAEDKGEEPKSETKPKAKRPFGPSAVCAILASEAKKRDQGDELAACLAAGEFVMRRVLWNHRYDKDVDEMEARVFGFIYRAHQRAGQNDKQALRLTKAWVKEAKRPPKFTVETVTRQIAEIQYPGKPKKATWIRATIKAEQERYSAEEMAKLEAAIIEALRPAKFSPKKAGELVAAALRQGSDPVGQARWILDTVERDNRYSHQERHDLRSAVKIALKSARMAMAKPATNAILEQLLKKQPKREPPKPAGLHGGPKPKEPGLCYGSTAAKQPERRLSPEEREELKLKQELAAEAAKAERIRRQAEAEAARKLRGYGEQKRVAPPKPKPQDKDEGKNKGKGGRNQRAA